jgi:hypothetical protein
MDEKKKEMVRCDGCTERNSRCCESAPSRFRFCERTVLIWLLG